MIRQYNQSEDYETARAWWRAWGWTELPKEALPQTGLVVCSTTGEPKMMAWLYKTDSSIAWLEFIVSDPTTDSKLRGSMTRRLIGALTEKAKEFGFSSVFTSTDRPSLGKAYEDQGYILTDRQTNFYIRRI